MRVHLSFWTSLRAARQLFAPSASEKDAECRVRGRIFRESKRMPRHRSSLFVARVLLATGVAIGLLYDPTPGHAQQGAAATLTSREQQFESLCGRLISSSRQANILKTVIKLVSPSVVHIDAERIEALGRSRRGLIEEAGSGVIIEMAGKPYVLTNRHVIKNHNKQDIKIRLFDNHEMHPQQIWSDPDTDIALMLVTGDDLVPGGSATATISRLATQCWRWAARSDSAVRSLRASSAPRDAAI